VFNESKVNTKNYVISFSTCLMRSS